MERRDQSRHRRPDCSSRPGSWDLEGGHRWVFIDWDNAGPGSRLWDLAYAAHGFIPLAPDAPIAAAARRLAALADGYRLDERGRSDLADLLVPRIMSMYDLLHEGHRSRAQPWARLWSEGHARVWLAHAGRVNLNWPRGDGLIWPHLVGRG